MNAETRKGVIQIETYGARMRAELEKYRAHPEYFVSAEGQASAVLKYEYEVWYAFDYLINFVASGTPGTPKTHIKDPTYNNETFEYGPREYEPWAIERFKAWKGNIK